MDQKNHRDRFVMPEEAFDAARLEHQDIRQSDGIVTNAPKYEADDGPLSDKFMEFLQQRIPQQIVRGRSLFGDAVPEENDHKEA